MSWVARVGLLSVWLAACPTAPSLSATATVIAPRPTVSTPGGNVILNQSNGAHVTLHGAVVDAVTNEAVPNAEIIISTIDVNPHVN